ncbi:MAG: hypothetical protein QGF49_00410 [Candidatus Marinimicrobia bacterium]|nr:hypothetical protein [Candidatus Neomarinimicrobiota bacterium]MDP7127137.1 hypothetical protein [Candidatus Neomarinimicrobiota bacterium]MDP7336573.1 hypothetical protein [Candidatus Neomarinimicrobiota bacterium]
MTDAEGVLEWSQVYENDGDDDVLVSTSTKYGLASSGKPGKWFC